MHIFLLLQIFHALVTLPNNATKEGSLDDYNSDGKFLQLRNF